MKSETLNEKKSKGFGVAKFVATYVVLALFSTISCVPKQGIKTQAQIPPTGKFIAEQSPLLLACEPWLIEKLRLTLGDEKVSCYQEAQIELTAGAKGWLITANSSDSSKTDLIWVVDQAGNMSLQKPLDEVKEENQEWDFLDIDSIFDFDRDGSLESLVIGTGGGGMYYHYPIILRLGAKGNWEVLFAPDKPFFYGTTKLLSTDSDGRIRLAITSVDRDAPWAFLNCSLCSHPFKREIYSLVNSKLQVSSKSPVAYPLATVSDLILAVQSNSLAISYGYFSNNATVGGE